MVIERIFIFGYKITERVFMKEKVHLREMGTEEKSCKWIHYFANPHFAHAELKMWCDLFGQLNSNNTKLMMSQNKHTQNNDIKTAITTTTWFVLFGNAVEVGVSKEIWTHLNWTHLNLYCIFVSSALTDWLIDWFYLHKRETRKICNSLSCWRH